MQRAYAIPKEASDREKSFRNFLRFMCPTVFQKSTGNTLCFSRWTEHHERLGSKWSVALFILILGQIPVPKTPEDNKKLFIISGIIQAYEPHHFPKNQEVYWEPKAVDPEEKTFFFWIGIERNPTTMIWNDIYNG